MKLQDLQPGGVGVVRLRAEVQHYAWGSRDFIPALLGTANPENKRFAELWMGAHPDLPAKAQIEAKSVPLNELIAADPDGLLGPLVSARFGGKLPYLFKVLSAAVPLSIQSHPTKAQAEAGFAREDAARIPLTARHRNYKDDNHKPEILAALTDFYALRGFRPLEEIGNLPAVVPEFRPVMKDYQPTAEGLRQFYQRLMTISQTDVNEILDPLLMRLDQANRQRTFRKDEREYWLLEADREFSEPGRRDRGLFSIYLLNLVCLRPGEAVYLPAGVLHAYLQGSGIELMANSNNVLRGGLTPKHIDVPELLANIGFEGGPAEVLRPEATPQASECVYRTPAAEFELRRIDVAEGQAFQSSSQHSADILIATNAQAASRLELECGRTRTPISKGEVLLAPWNVEYRIRAQAPATLFRASVPAN